MTIQYRLSISIGLIISTVLCACNPNPQPLNLTPIPTLAAQASLEPVLQAVGSPLALNQQVESAAIGAHVYQENCTSCHGVQGEGVDAPPLRNNKYIQTGGDEDIYATIAGGRSGTTMPAWLQVNGGSLTDQDIASLVAFLHSLQKVEPLPTATPMPPEPTEAPPSPGGPTPEPARPSNPGEVGSAASLSGDAQQGQVAFGFYCAACHGPEGRAEVGIPNPGSDDGIVPELNPIDPTIVDNDPKVFAANVDLFIEHGSIPEGPSPRISMPSFGDSKLLSLQVIADIIAYILSINSGN
jgi:mono/diheme cytochrome c family protein